MKSKQKKTLKCQQVKINAINFFSLQFNCVSSFLLYVVKQKRTCALHVGFFVYRPVEIKIQQCITKVNVQLRMIFSC